MRTTLEAVAATGVRTIFAEPVNIRAQNVARIRGHATQLGISLNTEVFSTADAWRSYAIGTLRTFERVATDLSLENRLHLWPDASLGTKSALARLPEHERQAHTNWLNHWWNRISEWPDLQPAAAPDPDLAQTIITVQGDDLDSAFQKAKEQALEFIQEINDRLPQERCVNCAKEGHIPGLSCPACGYTHDEPWLILLDTEFGYDAVSLVDRKDIRASFNVEE